MISLGSQFDFIVKLERILTDCEVRDRFGLLDGSIWVTYKSLLESR